MAKKPVTPQHVAIAASAGSGKTFQLAHRYIRLLVSGVPPERICALTFSRKAAQEIFDSIIEHLVKGAGSRSYAAAISKRIKLSNTHCEIYLEALRGMLRCLNRLQIGTLDSFIIGVVRAFPSELGIAMDFQVMDEGSAAAQEMRRDILSHIFDPRRIDQRAQADFFEAFKQATFGREEKSPDQTLERFIDDHHRHYQSVPSASAWGDPRTIWPQGPAWPPPAGDIATSVDQLRASLAAADMTEKRRERWAVFLDAIHNFGAHTMWSKHIEFLFTRLTAMLDDLRNGSATLVADRQRQELTADQCRLALEIIGHVMAVEIRVALETTRGLHRVLEKYHQVYDSRARRAGRMTFSDAQYLLTDANRLSGGLLLSRDSAATDRLFIDYRLDARLDHWLLDEFQDTSDLQWAAIGNLVDEIVQDASGERSFFYVGDVKQAIYTWRQGNPRLFARVLQTYGTDRIKCETLSTSYRSCEAIIDVVNKIFGQIDHPQIPAAARARWQEIWKTHKCRKDEPPPEGYAAILEPPYIDEQKPGEDDRYRVVAALIRELDPLKRGLEVAVLVRKNDSGRAVVDRLRRECPGLLVVHEGNAPICDNPAVSVLLSLVRFAAHPGDTFAWRHLQMSPLNAVIEKEGGRALLPLRILDRIHLAGFQQLMRDWSDKLETAASLDEFARMRLDDLARAAGEFDEMRSRECDVFLRFIDLYEISEIASGNAVRVMTIHQSKGLGFDVVILPDLMQRSMLKAHNIDVVEHRDAATDQPEWVIKMPRTDIREHDPVLAEAINEVNEDACFDSLCLLYVAMTRARRGLYVVSSYPGKSSDIVSEAALLKYQLIGDPKPVMGESITIGEMDVSRIFGHGKPDWYETLEPATAPPPADDAPTKHEQRQLEARHMLAVEPSGQELHERPAALLFSRDNQDALDLGNAIHALFEQVSWSEEAEPAPIIDAWRTRSRLPEEVIQCICTHFNDALGSAAFQTALARPGGSVTLWREKPFEVLLPGVGWVRGIFDRVVIGLNKAGNPESVLIQDYKSNIIRDETHFGDVTEGYRSQLRLYGQAAEHMFKLDSNAVTLQLLFTRDSRVYDLTAG